MSPRFRQLLPLPCSSYNIWRKPRPDQQARDDSGVNPAQLREHWEIGASLSLWPGRKGWCRSKFVLDQLFQMLCNFSVPVVGVVSATVVWVPDVCGDGGSDASSLIPYRPTEAASACRPPQAVQEHSWEFPQDIYGLRASYVRRRQGQTGPLSYSSTVVIYTTVTYWLYISSRRKLMSRWTSSCLCSADWRLKSILLCLKRW